MRASLVASLCCIALVGLACGRDDPPPAANRAAPAADPWNAPAKPEPVVARTAIAKLTVTDAAGSGAPLGSRLTKVTLLAFWASWCKPCLMELPQLDKLAADLHDPGFSVLAINVDRPEQHAAAVAALADHHIALPVVFDPEATVYDAIFGGIMTIPATAVVTDDAVVEPESGYDLASDAEFVESWKARLQPHLKVIMSDYELIRTRGVPIKAWTHGVGVEAEALEQLKNVAALPIVFDHVAVMPDVHFGIGATVGSVVPTKGAIIPAAVGVDIGCGMMAVETDLPAARLPDSLAELRAAIEKAVPHGRTANGRPGGDRGAWGTLPAGPAAAWQQLAPEYARLVAKHPRVGQGNDANHLGTLGTGNHFIEVCLDERDLVWFMLHSGSRGVGNRIGTYFIELAKKDMKIHVRNLPDIDLAYFSEGAAHFADYVEAIEWAQRYALENRRLMMDAVIGAARGRLPPFELGAHAVNCHHNYVAREEHFGERVFVTRKGAVRARAGDLGIIPGSMGAKSFIVRGKGNPDSFCSCSHGAGRAMSRGEAKRRFSVDDHAKATEGIECRKDAGVIDETPMAYKPIDAVMAAQADLVEVVHQLRQVVCVKG